MDEIIDDNSSSSSNDEPKCSICFEKFNNDEEQLKCSHIFHKKCIDEWKKEQPTCPICRYEIEGIKKSMVQPDSFINENYLEQALLGYTNMGHNSPNITRNETMNSIRKCVAVFMPFFCVLFIIIVIVIGIKSTNECFIVDCVGLDKKSCNNCPMVSFTDNKKVVTINSSCFWSEVSNSSDISVDCVRYDNTSLCFNLNECLEDCSKCCIKNICLMNHCSWVYDKWFNGHICQ